MSNSIFIPVFIETHNDKTTFMKIYFLLFFLIFTFTVTAQKKVSPSGFYTNPVIEESLPDPTIIRAEDGYFYLYATEDTRNTPIYKSPNLVDWEFVGTAFTKATRPDFEPKGGIWAPDIEYIDGKYVLYYALSRWGGEWTCGIGRAVSDRPEGPFTDRGKLFRSNEIQVQNSIDPFFIREDGKNYLFWGSFRGIYYIQLTDDGLDIAEGAAPTQIAGTAYEAVYIHKKGKYYYLFASVGSCCNGEQSTYTTVVGRSESLFGPYVNKAGNRMLDNQHEIVIHKNDKFLGTGHNAEIVTDDKGQDWMLYHAFIKGKTAEGRVLLMDQIKWKNGWPYVETTSPATGEVKAPVFKNKKQKISRQAENLRPVHLGDPFILLHEGKYYAYGTHAANGIEVWLSDDLKEWEKPSGLLDGLALNKKDVWADRWFWAPEVYYVKGRFYMYYSADEHICVATSDSPLGPFTQEVRKPMLEGEKAIDNSLFIDDDDKAYLFFDRFNDGLNIWVAELTDDLLNIKPETLHKCIAVSQKWEKVWPRVNEGSFITKHNGTYYMTYSANSYESPAYGIGYATTRDIMGEWTKYDQNPIYQYTKGLAGIGHSAMFRDKDGQLRIVFHAHNNKKSIHPRIMYISTVHFQNKDGQEIMTISPDYFMPQEKTNKR